VPSTFEQIAIGGGGVLFVTADTGLKIFDQNGTRLSLTPLGGTLSDVVTANDGRVFVGVRGTQSASVAVTDVSGVVHGTISLSVPQHHDALRGPYLGWTALELSTPWSAMTIRIH
jgi:hypothetical protein